LETRRDPQPEYPLRTHDHGSLGPGQPPPPAPTPGTPLPWTSKHFAERFLAGLDGDLRVDDDTLFVTFYNAPNTERLRQHYENLPAKLASQGVDPRIPWLFDFKLDFRFR
jgi:hypothetical protein